MRNSSTLRHSPPNKARGNPVKRCPKCGITKPTSKFYKRSDGRCESYCRECHTIASSDSRRRRVANFTDEERKQFAFSRRLTRFRISEDKFWGQLAEQQWMCVCGVAIDESTLFIDHDHACCPNEGSCGRCVRGFLCVNCNTALGHLKDSPDRAMSLAAYLLRFENVIGDVVTERS